MTKELRREVKGQAAGHVVMRSLVSRFCSIVLYFRSYLDLLLYVVEDEPLGVDEVVRGVERDGVQRAAVNAASIHQPATRFRPDESLNRRDKTLEREEEKGKNSVIVPLFDFHMIQHSKISKYLYIRGPEKTKTNDSGDAVSFPLAPP